MGSTAPLVAPNSQDAAQAPSPPQGVDVSAPSLKKIVVSGESTEDESTPSVESSIMALLDSDDNQVPTPVFDIEIEPSPEAPESDQDPDPSLKLVPSPETLESEQNPELSLELNPTQNSTSNDTLTNPLSTQAQLLAPKFINPNIEPSPSANIPMSPNSSQDPNLINNRPITSTSIGSPSVPSSIMHFNMLAANAQSPTRRNSMSAQQGKIENFMIRLEKKLDDFITDNQNTTQTLAGHAETLTSHGNTLASILVTQEKMQQDLTLLQQQNTALTQDLAQQSNKVTQLEKTIEDLKKSTQDLTADKADVQSVLKDMDNLKTQRAAQNETINTISAKQTTTSAKAIQEQVQSHIDVLNTQQFWQRELDKSANQLVFKNLAKTTLTLTLTPTRSRRRKRSRAT